MKKLFLLLYAVFFCFSLFATHNRAGEITYRKLNNFTYEITLVIYTKTSSGLDQQWETIYWGDNTSDSIPRVNGPNNTGEILSNNNKKNVYKGNHTYPSNGIYNIFFQDPNRTAGIINISNSVNIPF